MRDLPNVVTVRAPTRIDFGGGWTDVPPYCDREGGFVCNVAIARYATATVRARDASIAMPDPLIRGAFARTGVHDVEVTVSSDFPVGAGLGGSSAASAAVFGALAEWKHEPWDRSAIAELGRRVEVEDLGVAGGRQDHYAACYGGALALEFTTGVRVQRIPLPPATRAALERRLLLVYTGESRISGSTITAVLGAFERGDPTVCAALAHMRTLAIQMANALRRADVDALGALVAEHWVYQRSLDAAIPTARIDEIIARGRDAGALGAKALGASGGGTVVLIAAENAMDAVRAAVAPLGTVLPFAIDEQGIASVPPS